MERNDVDANVGVGSELPGDIMVLVRFSIGAFLVLGVAAAACSSSSTPPAKATNGDDASTDTTAGDDSGMANPLAAIKCGALSAAGGGMAATCPMGQTCCTQISAMPSASCVATGACSGGVSNECAKGSDCATGQVCCGGSADGGAPAATDAAAAGGIAGILGGFDPSMLSTTCQTSCAATQTQQCGASSECPTGQTCNAPMVPALLAGFLPMTCGVPPADAGTVVVDSGTPPVVEAGAPDTGSDMVDATPE